MGASFILLLILPSLITFIASLIFLFTNQHAKDAFRSRRKMIFPCLLIPGLLVVAAYYSLAFHMHHSLGQWPKTIGMQGFPDHLKTHCELSWAIFTAVLGFTCLVWPALVALTSAVPPLRRVLPPIMCLGVSVWICTPLIYLAPSEFQYWWWD